MTVARLTQWPVRHGGFHSQAVSSDSGPPTTFVYDCGSANSRRQLDRAIEDFSDSLVQDGVRRLTAIVISHLDRDHVNGLKNLADHLARRRITVENVVAPLVSAIDRLVLAANTADIEEDDSADDYVSIISDPFTALGALFGDGDTQIDLVDPDPDNNVAPNADDVGRASRNYSATVDPECWEVLVFAQRALVDARDELWVRAAPLLGLDPEIELTSADVVEILRPQTNRKILREVVQASPALRTNNFTSLLMYSGPSRDRRPHPWAPRLRPGATEWHVLQARGGWLGLGDAELQSTRALDRFVGMLGGPRLQRVTICGVPHHGSRENSSAALWATMPNLSVATFHAHEKYGHPHEEVTKALVEARIVGVRVGSDNERFVAESWCSC